MNQELKIRAKEFYVSKCGGTIDDFYIDVVIEIKSQLKIFFFIKPSDFEFMKSLGIGYVGTPGPAEYDIIKDKFFMFNPVSFLMEYGENEEYLAAVKDTTVYEPTYQDIIAYLDRRGYLFFDDFYNVLKVFNMKDKDELMCDWSKSRSYGFSINAPHECMVVLKSFLDDIKADYVVEGDEVFVKKDLLHSSTYYDRKTRKLISREKE